VVIYVYCRASVPDFGLVVPKAPKPGRLLKLASEQGLVPTCSNTFFARPPVGTIYGEYPRIDGKGSMAWAWRSSGFLAVNLTVEAFGRKETLELARGL
jgi:hypothetical protein